MKKPAFSMVTAIIFIIIVSVVGVSTLSLSRSTVSFASRNIVKEQTDIMYETAKQIAVNEWLKDGNINGFKSYNYPNDKTPEFKISIHYIQPVNKANLLSFDVNTVIARITVETAGVMKDIADIRLVKDFTIGN